MSKNISNLCVMTMEFLILIGIFNFIQIGIGIKNNIKLVEFVVGVQLFFAFFVGI